MVANDSSHNPSNPTYSFDYENEAEMLHLLERDNIINASMGGLFPGHTLAETEKLRMVLDVACGPGGWALNVAQNHPHIQVIGIDTSQHTLNYARAQAQRRGLDNVQFYLLDALKPSIFPEGTFDLVNIRFAVGFVPTKSWPNFVQEYRRVLKVGGILQLTEIEVGFTNAPNLEKLIACAELALHRAGRGTSPTGLHMGMVASLRPLLQQAGLHTIQSRAYVLDYAYGMPAYPNVYGDFSMFFYQLKPLIEATKVMNIELYETLYERAMQEMRKPNFSGVSFLFTAWGERPDF